MLASQIPYPAFNGEDLRVFHFARCLALRHGLHLVAYGPKTLPSNQVTRYFKSIYPVEGKSVSGSKRNGVRRLIEALSPERMYFFDPEISSLLSQVLREKKFDLIWIPAWQMIPYAFSIRDVPVFIDVMDDGVLELLREIRYSSSFKEIAVRFKRLFVTYLFERKYFPPAALCSLVSERDAEVLGRVCPTAKAVVIPNGVDGEYFKPLRLAEDYPSLIFEGNMSFAPNVDAVLYFCARIFPHVREKFPDTTLYIVGKDPTPEIQALAGGHIIVTGYVEDVRPFLDRASVFVCSMRRGAGIKNKILQAWAMAKPVVATSVAVGGLRAAPCVNIIVADGVRAFAREVVGLLQDPIRRREMGRHGRETVLAHFTWEKQVRSLEEALLRNL